MREKKMREGGTIPKIFLRKMEQQDSDLVCKWLNNKENVKYMSSFVKFNNHTRESILRSMVDSDDEELFIIMLDDIPIGHAGFEDIDKNDETAEIYIIIGELEFSGKGYGRIVLKELLEYGFNKLNLNNIMATAASENMASIKILQKNGFKLIGTRREYNKIDGRRVDELFFDIIRSDYNLMQNNQETK